MDGEKDRLGDKLRDLEQARENKYFAERDRELLAKLRGDPGLAELACPVCREPLEERADPPVRLKCCRDGHGFWISTEDSKGLLEAAAPVALARLIVPATPR